MAWAQGFGVDSSKINLPCELVDYGYKIVNQKNRHYPEGLISALYNLQEETIYDFILVNNRNERSCAKEHISTLSHNDVVIFDRGYFSYELLYYCADKEMILKTRENLLTYCHLDTLAMVKILEVLQKV